MNMFAKNAANTIDEYRNWVPDVFKKEIDFLHEFIQQAVPSLQPHYATNMIGYGSFYYLDSKKQKKEWPIISLAGQKNYISIYICAIIEDTIIKEKYLQDLGKLSKDLGCIRFKNREEINLETLKKVLQLAEKNPGLASARFVDK